MRRIRQLVLKCKPEEIESFLKGVDSRASSLSPEENMFQVIFVLQGETVRFVCGIRS